MADSITTLPSKKSLITKKALIIGGAALGVTIAVVALKKLGTVEVAEALVEAAQ